MVDGPSSSGGRGGQNSPEKRRYTSSCQFAAPWEHIGVRPRSIGPLSGRASDYISGSLDLSNILSGERRAQILKVLPSLIKALDLLLLGGKGVAEFGEFRGVGGVES